MPEIPTTKIGFMKEGVMYLLRLPLIELTCLTGKPFLKPFSAGIVVTNKCNLNCLFYFVNKEVEVIELPLYTASLAFNKRFLCISDST